MRNWVRTVGWIALTAVATYTISEWAVWQKSGLHDLRAVEVVVPMVVPVEPERVALQAQIDKLTQTFAEFRAATAREIQGYEKLIANLERQIRVLTAQRTPVEQVAALRATSAVVPDNLVRAEGRSVNELARAPDGASAAPSPHFHLIRLAREAGFTRVQVRP